MEKEILNLIEGVKNEINPFIIASRVSRFIVDSLKKNKINIYEAFLLNFEVIRLNRLGYLQPAWNGRVRISLCIAILNQKLLSHVINESSMEEKLLIWGLEAYRINKEKRPHYILDRYTDFLEAHKLPELLEELLYIRCNCKKLDFDDGPYHMEEFPYGYCNFEGILLNQGPIEEFRINKNLSEDVEELIVELNLM